MSVAYRLVKTAYRNTMPKSVDRFVFGGMNPLSRNVLRMKAMLERHADHDELYDQAYFERQDKAMTVSALGIATSIKERLDPASVVDFGCGSGSVIAALRDMDIRVLGLDYADAALDICRSKGLTVQKFDLENPTPLEALADVAVSTEVAEHLPESTADRYVDLLCRIGRIVVMTAATPGQGGTDHVNEQPNEYWIEKFRERGFPHDAGRTQAWRDDWRQRGVDDHRANNVMVFGPKA